MLSEDKIKKMIRLSEYELGIGREDLRYVKYSKTDFIWLQILKTVAADMLAASLFLVLLVCYRLEYVLQNALTLPLREIMINYVLCFLVICLISVIATWKRAVRQYKEAEIRVKEYAITLDELMSIYEKEENAQEDVES